MLIKEQDLIITEYLHWIYECNRFLFFSKVHLNNNNVYPEMQGDLVSFLEKILNECVRPKMNRSRREKLSLKNSIDDSTSVSSNELDYIVVNIQRVKMLYLKATLEKIINNQWDEIDNEEIVKSQEILYEILTLIKLKNGN